MDKNRFNDCIRFRCFDFCTISWSVIWKPLPHILRNTFSGICQHANMKSECGNGRLSNIERFVLVGRAKINFFPPKVGKSKEKRSPLARGMASIGNWRPYPASKRPSSVGGMLQQIRVETEAIYPHNPDGGGGLSKLNRRDWQIR